MISDDEHANNFDLLESRSIEDNTNDQEDEEGLPCAFCNGYYGPTTTGPVCPICHNFVFEYNTSLVKNFDDKDASDDSGNEDPEDRNMGLLISNRKHVNESEMVRDCRAGCYRPNIVSNTNGGSNFNYLEVLPTEVLLKIFAKLDDVSMWSVRFSAKRFKAIIDVNVKDKQWEKWVKYRWPLYINRVPDVFYRDIYSNMIQSVTCRTCWEKMRERDKFVQDDKAWLSRRLQMEVEILTKEHPYGICTLCIDEKTLATWIASIVGPPGSDYEGGLFYILIKIPSSYPLRPPHVQFLTRIYHPNISKHGDVGIDLLHSNWSLALTISKLLISIQSLLTDPYGQICMEPDIGEMYNNNPKEFKKTSRLWTWKFAMHDYIPPILVQGLKI